MKTITRTLAAAGAILFGAGGIPAQGFNVNTAPVKWQKYSVAEHNVTVSLPKMPVKVASPRPCFGEDIATYASYAEGKIYILRVTSKMEVPPTCNIPVEFSASNFTTRKNALMMDSSTGSVAKVKTRRGLAGKRVQVKFSKYFLFNDARNERWFELEIVSDDMLPTQEKRFLDSLTIGKKTNGIAIGEGSPVMLGDAMPPAPALAANEKKKPVRSARGEGTYGPSAGNGSGTEGSGGIGSGSDIGDGRGIGATPPPSASASASASSAAAAGKVIEPSRPIVLIAIGRPGYTEEARKNTVMGTVRLRVAFNSNGGIGSIAPVSGLPHGLTERAIATAKKIVFLPARKNGTRVSTSKVVEFSFNIY